LTEPKFKRGTDYNAMAVCDEGTATKKFALGQRASAFHLAIWEIGWLSDEANVNLAFWIGLFIMVILGAIFGIKWIARKMQRGL
jgi:hypothetical protein